MLKFHSPRWWPTPSAILRYAVAVLSVALAVVASRLSVEFLHTEPFVSLFLCAILFVGWFGGFGPGLFAVALASLAFDYYLVDPLNSFVVEITELPRLALFMVTALFVNFLSASQRARAEALRRSRDDLLAAIEDQKRIERALRLSEMYLADAQRLSRTGSFGWNVSTQEIFWSEETFRIFGYDRGLSITIDMVLQRTHPEDRASVQQTIDRAFSDGSDFDHEYRLLMPDGSVKHIRAVARAVKDTSGSIEFIGALTDVTLAKEIEARIQLIIDTVPALIWTARPDGSLDFVSRRWLDYEGMELEQKLASGFGTPLHPDDDGPIREKWRAAVAESKPFETEMRTKKYDGEYRWFLSRAYPLFDGSGHVLGWYGNNIDIHDRKCAEMLLAGEKHLLEMIARGDSRALILNALCRLVEERASGCLSSILLLDPNAERLRHGAAPSLPIAYTEAIDGLVIGPSAGSCGTAAYRAEQVIVSDIATDPLWADYRDLALANGLRACWSTPILSSTGTVLGTFAIYYREARSPTPQEYDVIEQITHLASIVVERKQAEEMLREQANLLNLTHDTVFVRDMSNVITYWNHGAKELYGWTGGEALHKVSHELMQTVFPAPLADINAELLGTGRWEGELIHTKRDGTQVVVASRWSLQRDEHGQPVAILETNNDLTNRKQAEEALRQAQAELAHATRVSSLGELTASIAHEVNQPLAGVVSSGNACLRWLANEPPNIENAKQSVERIIRDANRASDVVVRVRSLAKKTPVQKAWLNINETVLDTLALTRTEVSQHRASLTTQLSDNVPLVWADRIQLQQVILNLVMNAVEAVSALDHGPRDLLVATAEHESDGVLVTVGDSGSGLDPERLERIFDAFYSTKREGMGMGLAVSRSIIEAHSGRLWAAPNEPRGAVFQFTLPTGREEAA